MRVSHTQLDLYKWCPRKYKFYIDRAPQDPSRTFHLRFGKAVHKALEFAYEKRFKAPAPQQVVAYYKKLMKDETDPEVLTMFEKGITPLEKYVRDNPARDLRVLEVERKFVTDLTPEHQIAGVIDRMDMLPDGSFEIIDYKSGAIPNAEKLGDNWQLAIYQFAKQRQLQTHRIKASLVYIIYDGHKLTYQFNKEELETIREEILRLVATIQKDTVFQTRVGSWCNMCPYQPICPAWVHRFSYQEPVLTGKRRDTEAVDIQVKIDRLLQVTAAAKRLSAEGDQLKEIIGTFAKEKNLTRLYSDLGTVSLSFHTRRAYDVAKLVHVLREDLLRKITKTVDVKKLERALPYLPDAEREAIESSATEASSTTVTARPTLDEGDMELLTP